MSDFKNIINDSFVSILDYYHIQYSRGNIHCLKPENHSNGDSTPSMSVNIRDKYLNCFSCNAHFDSLGLIALKEGLDLKNDFFKIIEKGKAILNIGDINATEWKPESPKIDKKVEYAIDLKILKELIKFSKEQSDNKLKVSDYFVKYRSCSEELALEYSKFFVWWYGSFFYIKNGFKEDDIIKAGFSNKSGKLAGYSKTEGFLALNHNGFKFHYFGEDIFNKEKGKKGTQKMGSTGGSTFPFPAPIDYERDIYLVEGEIDAAAMHIMGFNAYSGGGKSFCNDTLFKQYFINENYTGNIIIVADPDVYKDKNFYSHADIKKLAKFKELGFNGGLFYTRFTEKDLNFYDNNHNIVKLKDADDFLKKDKTELFKKILPNRIKEFSYDDYDKKYQKENEQSRKIALKSSKKNEIEKINELISSNDGLFEKTFKFYKKEFFFNAHKIRLDILGTNNEAALYRLMVSRIDFASMETARLYLLSFFENNKSNEELIKIIPIDFETSPNEKINQIIIYYDDNLKYWRFLQEDAKDILYAFSNKFSKYFSYEKSRKNHFFNDTNFKRECFEHVRNYADDCLTKDSNFYNIVKGKITISSKEGVLIYDDDKSKFILEPYSPKFNLLKEGFPFRRFDENELLSNENKVIREEILNFIFSIFEFILEEENIIDKKEEILSIQDFILSYIGYTLTTWRSPKSFLYFLGGSNSGKTTLVELIGACHRFTNTYATIKSTNYLENKRFSSKTMFNRHCVFLEEWPVDQELTDDMKFYGQNRIASWEDKNIKSQKFFDTSTIIIDCNSSPKITDYAMIKRLMALHLKNDFPESSKGSIFIDKFNDIKWGEVLFNMAIDSAEKTIFKDKKFNNVDWMPSFMKKEKDNIEKNMNPLLAWFDDCIENQELSIIPKDITDINIIIPRKDLWDLYEKTFKDRGYGSRTLGRNQFYKRIEQKYSVFVGRTNISYIIGLKRGIKYIDAFK